MGAAAAIATLFAHLATDGRYGYFRDELYFIACGKHLAWGYVDQPPLVALDAFASSPFHYAPVALRAPVSIAAALAVWLAARIASELGGGTFARATAALTVALLPAYLLLGNTLTTTSFEPLSWTLVCYAAVRLIKTGDERYWLAAALAFAFGMYGKYSMLLLGAALIVSIAASPARTLLRTRSFAAACAVAAAALFPNLLWQGMHAWPFLQVVAGDFAHRHAFQTGLVLEYKNALQNAGAFAIEQLVYTNPVAALLWIGGIGALLAGAHLRAFRFLGVAALIVLAAAIVLEAKGYYVIGIYATLLAAGAVAFERAVRSRAARTAALCAYSVLALAFAPLSLPVLPVDALIAYTQRLHLTGTGGQPAHLIQPVFAEEFGWRELTQRVASVYDSLPPQQRLRTAVFADTYADAGALALYGSQYGLPPPISAQNTFYLWGTGGYDGASLIVVGASQADLVRTLYRSMRLAATYGNPYKWVVEGPTPIYICTDPIAPLPQLWPRLRWYGA